MAVRLVQAQAAGVQLSAKVVIVGNGIAGTTAALRVRQLAPEAEITMISEETPLFYSRTALMYVYMRQLQFADTVVHPADFYRKQRIILKQDLITSLDRQSRQLAGESGTYGYDYLLLAPGSRPRLPGLAGEDRAGVQGLYSKADLDRLEAQTRTPVSHAVIAGGGLIGVELAEMLSSRRIPVTMLVREPLYFSHVLPQEEAHLVTNAVRQHINLRLGTTLSEIRGDTAVRSVITSAGDEVPCALLGLTIGVEPRTELARSAGLAVRRGIVTDEFLRTADERVYAAGDAAELPLPGGESKVQQIWYTGRLQGEVAGANLAAAISGKTPTAYDPGIYFNSARFFTLDYQTYGQVPVTAGETNSLLWQNSAEGKLLRITYDPTKPGRPVTGFNALGLRLLHPVCEAWIREKTSLESVVQNFDRAIFDPEFSKRYTKQLRNLL
ncbi:MAG: NAD(P)/FAD-dependent oxidoreductase [Spirochaetota bacterium]